MESSEQPKGNVPVKHTQHWAAYPQVIQHVHIPGRCETVTAQNHLVPCKLMLSVVPV